VDETLYIRIPMERVGVLIGPDGSTKTRIEEEAGITLDIDSETGEVSIDEAEAEDPSMALKVLDIAKAIGRGFSEERALRLLDPEEYFRAIDIRDYAGKNRKRIAQLKGRLIGRKGKTRRIIEELTGVDMSVYGNTVSIIGDMLRVDIAERAVEMVLEGSEHASVYRYLENKRKEIKMAEMGF
jgi:ribosomal RNA assembly protein